MLFHFCVPYSFVKTETLYQNDRRYLEMKRANGARYVLLKFAYFVAHILVWEELN